MQEDAQQLFCALSCPETLQRIKLAARGLLRHLREPASAAGRLTEHGTWLQVPGVSMQCGSFGRVSRGSYTVHKIVTF